MAELDMLNSKEILANSGVKFGTSGARGLVEDFTPEVCAAFTYAFINAMKAEFTFEKVAVAIDNRPSSPGMAKAVAAALKEQNIEAVYYGVIPTPALAYAAMEECIPSIMITGSHIPFDRNGIKFYRPDGEISKQDELAIVSSEVEYLSLVNLPELKVDSHAANIYIARYTSVFSDKPLDGKHIGIYEHSSAGRELYKTIFEQLGASVTCLGRSDKFVPIDTEAVAEEDRLQARAWSKEYGFDAIFSTDGDGDRPLLADENGEWLRGDILCLIAAKALAIEALAVPVSCNTSIELSNSFKQVERTKIGSPYVIAEFDNLLEKYKSVAGFEANGGFMLASIINISGVDIKPLPTRDAVIPAVVALIASKNIKLSEQVFSASKRVTSSDRLSNFPNSISCQIIDSAINFPSSFLESINLKELEVKKMNTLDGVRLEFKSGEIIHLRPSGNAPELRCYVESDKAPDELLNKVINNLKVFGGE